MRKRQKYKKFHGASAVLPVAQLPRQQIRFTKVDVAPIPPEMARKLADQQRKDEEFTRQFGHVRPPTAIEVKGYKLVVASGGFICQPAGQAKYFTDILLTFYQNVFGREWTEAEYAKPRGERHPVI